MASSLDKLVSNLFSCGKCESCKPGDCLKRYIKDGKIVQWKGIGSCGLCLNCELAKQSCLKPVDTHLQLTKKHEKIHLLMRKGIYPFDYMSDFSKFDETELPPKEVFYSKLTGSVISNEECEHVVRWVIIMICISNPMSYYSMTSSKILKRLPG